MKDAMLGTSEVGKRRMICFLVCSLELSRLASLTKHTPLWLGCRISNYRRESRSSRTVGYSESCSAQISESRACSARLAKSATRAQRTHLHHTGSLRTWHSWSQADSPFPHLTRSQHRIFPRAEYAWSNWQVLRAPVNRRESRSSRTVGYSESCSAQSQWAIFPTCRLSF
jgi:hypothetical protein